MKAPATPQSWQRATLGELVNLSTGKLDANAAVDRGRFPFFTCAEAISRIDNYAFDTDAVLLAGNGSFSVKRYSGKFNAYQRTYVIEPIQISLNFLYWLTRGHISLITQGERGSTIPYIRKGDITGVELSLPPLAEQKIIADKLDTLLAQVENTKARLECIPQILKRFRQSVLTVAISGELTKDWRNSSHLGNWTSGALGDFIEKPKYGTSAKSLKDGLIPVLRMGNLQDGKLDWSDLVYSSDLAEIEKYQLTPGDVLFNRTNSPELVGKTSIYRGEREAIYAGYLIKIKCSELLNPEFLNYHLNSPYAKDYYKAVKSDGVSQSNINAKKLSAYPIHCPPIEEQAEIVRQIEQLFAFADTIEKQINNALARVEYLTQSILAKAFRGELTEQWREDNPHLISGDNSATALLMRIHAERVAKPPKKKIIRARAR
ncbi:restriction endonuclease subunit S [Microbulbifer hainanensis]|uniref:restriction endonuclease subunit S n=1 Tax=Microbulbifer hainanensis TaxID=2735675 RepID=UPI0029C0F5B3|nr:restriction endonuclease subunit S [Microbulbifer hainanensis]